MALFPERALPPEIIKLSSGPVQVQKFGWRFQRWRGAVPEYKFGDGKKPYITWEGEPAFAELALISILRSHGFTEAVWRDNFGPGWFRDAQPPASREMPECFRDTYERIVAENGGRGGCWDVLAFGHSGVTFVECKWKGNDHMKPSQIRWLDSALRAGLRLDDFAICEWTLE